MPVLTSWMAQTEVVPLEHLHGDQRRASSFGSVASTYDDFRPDYPPALFDDLLAEPVGTALDVGCGTGKVAVELRRRGVTVLGVDPDPRMAAVAAEHGVDVEVTQFERWDDAGRRFDLITCGHAWHWVDPAKGAEAGSRVLRPGARIARFWNYHVVPPRLLREFEEVYADLAPALTVIGRDPSRDSAQADPLGRHTAFVTARPRTYRWVRRLTSDQWSGLISTFSDHQLLGLEALFRLTTALETVIQRHGGIVTVNGGTYLQLARRV
ncbi:class I SAM-dependent methyltransferase [Terrabacter lapilli]|uniref:Class I SAM-dependent methyltransferase n=1 Tax=Terrabacter lapilli TaxID=436231 RepID=A0ABP5E8Z7_9MICO